MVAKLSHFSPGILHALAHLVIPITMWNNFICWLDFTDRETEAMKRWAKVRHGIGMLPFFPPNPHGANMKMQCSNLVSLILWKGTFRQLEMWPWSFWEKLPIPLTVNTTWVVGKDMERKDRGQLVGHGIFWVTEQESGGLFEKWKGARIKLCCGGERKGSRFWVMDRPWERAVRSPLGTSMGRQSLSVKWGREEARCMMLQSGSWGTRVTE